MADLFSLSPATEQRGILYGELVFHDRVFNCILRDISEGGARIEGHFQPPAMFALDIPNLSLRVWARRVWSSGQQHGLAFFEPTAAGRMCPLSDGKAAALRNLRKSRDDSAEREAVDQVRHHRSW